jgi:hypothetical protein
MYYTDRGVVQRAHVLSRVVHPFLLADNRHYPFYIWRRIINRHAYSRYTLAPMYLGCGTALWYLTGEWIR